MVASLLKMKIAVVIPVYNEEATISQIVSRVRLCSPDAEIIIVNDASTDMTRKKLDSLVDRWMSS